MGNRLCPACGKRSLVEGPGGHFCKKCNYRNLIKYEIQKRLEEIRPASL